MSQTAQTAAEPAPAPAATPMRMAEAIQAAPTAPPAAPESGANAAGTGVNSDFRGRTERRGAAEARTGRHFHTAL